MDFIDEIIDNSLRLADELLEILGENVISPAADFVRGLPGGENLLDSACDELEKWGDVVEKIELEDIVRYFLTKK